jgi:hypothetical protein
MNLTAWENADSRKAIIQVTGARCRQLRKSNYTVIVPYNRLSKTIQQITRTGGRIIQVTIQSASLFSPETKSNEITTAQPSILPSVEVSPVKEETTTEKETTTTFNSRRRKSLLERSRKTKQPSKHRAKKIRRRTKLSY